MAPGRPSPVNQFSNGNGHATNGHHSRRRRLDQRQSAETQSLPEYLYNAHARLAYTGAYGRELLLLVDANNGDGITYRRFQVDATVLARNLETRCGVVAGDTIAILSESNIDIPIVSVAAWNARATIVILPPDATINEQQAMLVQHLPRVMCVSQALLARTQQLLSVTANARSVQIVVIDNDGEEHGVAPSTDSGDRAIWSIQELYMPDPNGPAPVEQQPLSENEAQELTAIIYFTHQPSDGDSLTVVPNIMSHYEIISLYRNSLRRSPSLPNTRSFVRQAASTSSRPQTPMARAMPVRPQESNMAALDHTPDIAFAVLRMHRAYRLHRVVFDIFCRGARYLVAHTFDPAQFAHLVGQYELTSAEMTFAEIDRFVSYMQTHTVPRSSSSDSAASGQPEYAISSTSSMSLLSPELADMLSTLRFIYTESPRAEPELGLELARLLPGAHIVRTRFGSYVELPV